MSIELAAVEVRALTRQEFVLRGALAAAAASGVAAAGPLVAGALAEQTDGDVGVLNFALGFEHLSVAFYRAALAAGVLDDDARKLARTILAHEQQHVEALAATVRKLGGEPARAARVDFGPLSHSSRILRLAQAIEDLGVSAYNGAAPSLHSKEVLAAAGSIVQVEGRHAAAIRYLRGNPIAATAFDQGRGRREVLRGIGQLSRD